MSGTRDQRAIELIDVVWERGADGKRVAKTDDQWSYPQRPHPLDGRASGGSPRSTRPRPTGITFSRPVAALTRPVGPGAEFSCPH